MPAESEAVPAVDDVDLWFELSYSNYAVLPRTLMQSMPQEWQVRMVACLREMDAAFDHIEKPPGYDVRACEWLTVDEASQDELRAAGVTVEWPLDPDGTGVLYDRDGNELGPCDRVAVPRHEPIPHYRRGRARIEPRLSGVSDGH